MKKPQWKRDSLGHEITRTTGADGLVSIRRAWDGGVRVVVRRAVPFGPGSSAVVFMISHQRRFDS